MGSEGKRTTRFEAEFSICNKRHKSILDYLSRIFVVYFIMTVKKSVCAYTLLIKVSGVLDF
jgi:hypothetical protein